MDVNALFEAHQSQWSEAIYNEDAWRKAVEPLEQGDALYLPMQKGKKEQHFKHWAYNRFRYMDSKFETGSAMSDRITMRAHAQGSVFLTRYINMYGQVYFNAAMDQHRMVRDQEYAARFIEEFADRIFYACDFCAITNDHQFEFDKFLDEMVEDGYIALKIIKK